MKSTSTETWDDVVAELKADQLKADQLKADQRRRQPPPQSNVLAAGCLISVMAILYTTIGFVIGYVIRGL